MTKMPKVTDTPPSVCPWCALKIRNGVDVGPGPCRHLGDEHCMEETAQRQVAAWEGKVPS